MRLHRILAALGGAAALVLAGAPAGAQAEHDSIHFIVASVEPFIGPCDGAPGTLTLDGEGVAHFTDSGQSFALTVVQNGRFVFDPDDPTLPTAAGHFVAQHREHVNDSQLHDLRITDTLHAVAEFTDGTRGPVHVMLTVLVSADGAVEVKIDSIRCGGQPVI